MSQQPATAVAVPDNSDPKLRHEFVGMMFAVAIGEIGLQIAELVQLTPRLHFLPAYMHLFLATIVIATSWVGWTLSPSPGARQDVRRVFSASFFVLLIDVLLVILYFILAKTVDFRPADGKSLPEFHPSARPEARLIMYILWTYLLWDVFTKVVIYFSTDKKAEDGTWWPNYGMRFLPTITCIAFAHFASSIVATDWTPSQVVLADIGLLSLVLFFRAGKDLISAFFPTEGKLVSKRELALSIVCATLFCVVFFVAILNAKRGPLVLLEKLMAGQSTTAPATGAGP